MEYEQDKPPGAPGGTGTDRAISTPEPLEIVRSVYVAGSSAEIDRAERVIAELERAGIRVTSTWPINVRDVGAANPREASVSDRFRWSSTCLTQVRAADLVLFLVPPPSAPTRGAWAEIGYAIARAKTLILAGDTKQSIFCALGYEYETDNEALELILRVADRQDAVR